MTNLKTAAHNLLTTLKNAAKTNGDVKVAIIPFDTTVNLGTSYKDNDWFEYRQPELRQQAAAPAATGRIIGKAACATAPILTTCRTIRRPPAIPRPITQSTIAAR